MKAKLIHYDQFANRCLSQPFTALVSNGEKFCKSRRVSYDVICTSIAVLAWCSTVPFELLHPAAFDVSVQKVGRQC